MNANVYVTEDYENETTFRPKKTNPIQTQFPSRNAGRINRRVFYFDSLCGFGYSIGCFVTWLMVTEP